MIKFISMLLILVFSSSLYAAMTYEECLSDYQDAYQRDLKSAKAEFDREYKYCFKFPVGEEFESCTYQAYKTLNDANQAASNLYFEGMRYCQKYPIGF